MANNANKRAALPGLLGGSSAKYPSTFPKTKRTTVVFVQPTGGFQEASPTVRFDIKLAPNEIARFSDEPVTVEFTAKMPNPDHQAGSRDADRMDPLQYTQPHQELPPYYLNPNLKGASFFSKVEINLDGQQVVTSENLEDRCFLYQNLHRVFTNDSIRKRKYGERGHWISTTLEKTIEPGVVERAGTAITTALLVAGPMIPVPAREAVPAKIPKALSRAMESLQFDGKRTSLTQVVTAGWDSTFPFSVQNNALESLTKRKIENPYLPPGCQVAVTLHKRNPLWALIERANVTDAQYWHNTAACPARTPVTVTIVSVSLAYESTIVENEAHLASLTNSERVYAVDVPIMRMTLCDSPSKYDEKTFSLPKNCKIIYLSWVHQDQFNLNETLNKYLSARSRFPPNLTQVDFSIPGKEGLLSADGIKNLGIDTGFNSPSLRAYHRKLFQDGVYDKDFDSFSPNRVGENISFDQAIVLSLKDHEIGEGTQLKVTMRYSDTLSQPRWHLNAFCVVQRQLECSTKKIWTWKDL
jgi:hypothetical protein